MPQLQSLISFLDTFLETSRYTDISLNGLQVESSGTEVRTLAVAVDAGMSVIEAAVEKGADLLIVHHGLFWGDQLPITKTLAKKIELLQRSRCSLYASHLPLDGHPEVGNAACLARELKLTNMEGYFGYRGMNIGTRARSEKPRHMNDYVEMTTSLLGVQHQVVLPFGSPTINTVGIVTGSGSSAIPECAENNIDLLITGEPKQEAYHLAKDLKVNVLFTGHYATETFGVRALAAKMEKSFDLQTLFIDEPTGI